MSDIFQILADSTRRDILTALLEAQKDGIEGMSVSDLVGRVDVSQPTVSKHLKMMRDAEIVEVSEEGQRRLYTLNAEPLTAVEDYILPFMLVDVDAEFSVDYIDEVDAGAASAASVASLSGASVGGASDAASEILPESALAVAQGVGRSAGLATKQVKQLVAKFRIG